MARIPYRDGVQAQNDVAEGRLQSLLVGLCDRAGAGARRAHRHRRGHRDEPAAILPGTPTVAQAGYPELSFDGLIGLFGPREMAPALRERIAADIRTALGDPAIVQRLTATGQVVAPGSAAEFAAVDRETEQPASQALPRCSASRPRPPNRPCLHRAHGPRHWVTGS